MSASSWYRQSLSESLSRAFNTGCLLFLAVVTLYPFWYVLIGFLSHPADVVSGGDPVLIERMLRQLTAPSVQKAALILTAAPLVIVYPFLQRFFVKGALIGSIRD